MRNGGSARLSRHRADYKDEGEAFEMEVLFFNFNEQRVTIEKSSGFKSGYMIDRMQWGEKWQT
jgi:hypothetical protein